MTYQDKKRLKAVLEFRDPECKRDLLELIVYDRWDEKEIKPLHEFLSLVFDELMRGFEELEEG